MGHLNMGHVTNNTGQHFIYSGTPEADWIYKGF